MLFRAVFCLASLKWVPMEIIDCFHTPKFSHRHFFKVDSEIPAKSTNAVDSWLILPLYQEVSRVKHSFCFLLEKKVMP